MSVIIAFITKYFLEGVIVAILGIVTKFLSKFLSNDRIQKIKDAVLTAMLYAEEFYGIGQGTEKWELAWQKLIEILQTEGIELTEEEIRLANITMKAKVPEINCLTYGTCPEPEVKAHIKKLIITRSPEAVSMIEGLKKKYPKESSPQSG